MNQKILINQILLLLILLTGVLEVVGQQKTISGFVFDKNSKEPLIGANVYIKEPFLGTTTNAYGFFSLQTPNHHGRHLTVSFTGYATQVHLVDSIGDKSTFYLEGGIAIEEVGVTYRKKIEEKAEMSMFHLPLAEIELMPQLFQEDLIKAIQFLPGIQGGKEGSAGMYVRGGETEQNLVLLDDVPIYYANHAGNLVSTFDNNTIKDFSLYKGAFPARYGGRMSSVLDIRMKEGDKNKYHGEVGLGIISGNVFLEGPIVKDKASFFISYRKFWPSYLLDIITNGETNYSFSDFSSKIAASISEKDKLTISFYRGGDKFQITKKKEAEDDPYSTNTTDWTNIAASLKYTRKISPKWFSDLTAYYTKYNYLGENVGYYKEDGDTVYNKLFTNYSSMIADYSIKTEFEYYPSNQLKLKFGGQFIKHSYLPGASQYGSTGFDLDIRDALTFSRLASVEPSAFIEAHYSPNQHLNCNIGMRSSYLIGENYKYPFIEPRLMVSYNIDKLFAIKASYGLMTQNINRINYSGTGFQNDIWLPPTDIVQPGKSMQGAIGLFKTLSNGTYEISIEAYSKTLSNLIAFKPGESFFAGNNSWDEKIETNGIGTAKGIEFYLQKKEGKLKGWVSYTLAKATRQFENTNTGKVYPFNYDRRHDFSVVANYPLSKRWTLSGTFVYGSGYPFTIAFTEYLVEGYATDYSVGNYKGINAYRMEDYHRLDMGLTYKRQRKKTENVWNFSIYNLYNRKNPYYYEYLNTNSGVNLYKYSMFPIMPSISYSIKF